MIEPSAEKRGMTEKRIDGAVWGSFFVWIGIALLASLSWGVWLLGAGVIVLGAQVVRRLVALRLETFWIIAGVLFVIGGIAELAHLALDIAIIPILCIIAGAGLLVNALRHPPLKARGA